MNKVIRIALVTSILSLAVFSLTAESTFAWADGSGGEGGCCGGGEYGGGGSYDYGGGGGEPYLPPTVTYTPATCNYLNASATSVKYGGENVTLSWATTNATSVSISGIGSVGGSGSKSVFVSSNTTYTLTAVGAGGNANCAVTITVQPKTVTVAKCNYLNASQTSVPSGGANVTLSWSTTNATSVSISGIGSVNANGSMSVFVSGNATYTLTATGPDGNGSCTVNISTYSIPGDTPRCVYLRVTGDDDIERGDRVTLSWQTNYADLVTIDPRPGSVSQSGSESVTITDDVTTFTLRARNTQNSKEASCTVTVRVDKDQPSSKTPRCELEVSKSRVNRGERVTLSWDTTNVDSFRIRDDRGNEIFNTSSRRYLDGEVDVIINQTTEFIMTARNDDGDSRTCRVTVKTDDISVYEKRDQGYVIALTQVPYTGFEAGTFLTFLFYAVLTLWALFIAYILVIKKGSVLGFSLYGQNAGMSEADTENRKKVEALVAKYSGLNQN